MAAADLQAGVYYIQNIGSGTVVDLKDGSSVDGTIVQGFAKHELSDGWVPTQLWVISKGSDGSYNIENANSRTFLDLRNSTNGTVIRCYGPNGSDNQKWVITRSKKATAYVITNKATKTNVDLDNGSGVDGAKVQGWATITPDNINQLWLIVRA